MEYFRYMVFERHDAVTVERPEKFGGNLEIGSYAELVEIYTQGKLHPMDLKGTAAKYIDGMVEPVRTHFEKNARAKKLLTQVKGFSVTR
jgi:tyrosyl-tRNA synthetase